MLKSTSGLTGDVFSLTNEDHMDDISFNLNALVLRKIIQHLSNGNTHSRCQSIEPAHKLKIDQNKLQNCRSNILNLVNVL
ncbi:hypothetical protein D1AOALGA4SA_8499 [Olavius algarvensis Delta 1 endosymbiont]|nr:hypothetical protein D1AOALGA4SA_8499 [Olavius algarvensis Delta 1 endosymbiont]